MTENIEVHGVFRYQQDSKRYHRFQVECPDAGVTGSIYIPKDLQPLPKTLVLQYAGKDEE